MKPAAVLFIILFFLFASGHVNAGRNNWADIEQDIEKSLHSALKLYEKGKASEAMEKAADAYFGIFEGDKANMEIAVRRYLSLKKATELEKGFGDIRKAMFNKIPAADIKKQTAVLIEKVKAAAKELDRKGVRLSSEF